MGFRATVAGLTLASVLALTALTACDTPSSNPNPTPTPESIVQVVETPTPIPEVTVAPSLKIDYEKLSYTDGDVSWTAEIANGIEETVLKLSGGNVLRTTSDFLINGALVDEKYGRVVAWGEVQNLAISKVSARNLETGKEVDPYWLNGNTVNGLQLVYDVPTADGPKDYMVIVGYMNPNDLNNDFFGAFSSKKGYSINQIPFIEIRELSSGASKSVAFNPLALVEGEVTEVNAVVTDIGLEIGLNIVTYDDRRQRNKSETTIRLEDVFDRGNYRPIFGN